MDLRGICLLALASHVLFSRYEPSAIFVAAMYGIGSVAFITMVPAPSPSESFLLLVTALFTYTSTLFLSMSIYRLFFHRIRHFPGPVSYALTKWRSVPINLTGKRHVYIDQLHKKYGDIVRIGPRELSINDAKAIPYILGSNSKGPSYAAIQGDVPRSQSLFTTAATAPHRIRRGPWETAFSTTALKTYETIVKTMVDKLLTQFEDFATKGDVIDGGRWCQYLTFDIMSVIGLSCNFDLMGNGDFTRPVKLVQEAMGAIMTLGTVPYMGAVVRLLPNPIIEMENWVANALKEREKDEADVTVPCDLMGHILNGQEKSGELTRLELIADGSIIIIAGSDTTSSVMAMSIYNLMGHPEVVQQLRDELDEVFGDEEADDLDRLSKKCKVLDAIINESMRVHSPALSGVTRETPPQGMTIKTESGDLFLPGNIVVSIPTNTLHHDPRYFSPEPDAFRPERWLHPENEEAFNKQAVIPFAAGMAACVGKYLAWMEIRLMLAKVYQRFDITPAPGFDYADYPSCIQDHVTTNRTLPLSVVIKKRVKTMSNGD